MYPILIYVVLICVIYVFRSEKNYNGKNVALLIEGTTCTASEQPPGHNCTNVMDGTLEHRWASSIKDDSQWIMLIFNKEYQIQRLDIRHSCKNSTQCNTMEIIFDSDRTFTVSMFAFHQN